MSWASEDLNTFQSQIGAPNGTAMHENFNLFFTSRIDVERNAFVYIVLHLKIT